MQIKTSAVAEAAAIHAALPDDVPYSYWGAEFEEDKYALAAEALGRGTPFERILSIFAVRAAARLDDHHVVVSGETYVPAGILAGITSDFLTWAQREGLITVTQRGIAHACFGND